MTTEPSRLRCCPVCSDSVSKPLAGYESVHLRRCQTCGLVFSGLEPSFDELQAHYARYDRGNVISYLTLDNYQQLLSRWAPARQTGALLDVGAGSGHFVAVAHRFGWRVFATEFTPDAVALCRARGAVVHTGDLAAAPFAAASFDIITAFEVVEHVPDPLSLFQQVSRLLRPGGLFYLTTPNFNALSRWVLGPQWHVIDYPDHLTYFTPCTLRQLARQAGLQVEWMRTEGLISQLVHLPGLVAPVEDKAQALESLRYKTRHRPLWRLAKRALNAVLRLTGTGDTLKALLRRPF